MSDKRDEYTYMARLAEQTERWEDMVRIILNNRWKTWGELQTLLKIWIMKKETFFPSLIKIQSDKEEQHGEQ